MADHGSPAAQFGFASGVQMPRTDGRYQDRDEIVAAVLDLLIEASVVLSDQGEMRVGVGAAGQQRVGREMVAQAGRAVRMVHVRALERESLGQVWAVVGPAARGVAVEREWHDSQMDLQPFGKVEMAAPRIVENDDASGRCARHEPADALLERDSASLGAASDPARMVSAEESAAEIFVWFEYRLEGVASARSLPQARTNLADG